jgi:DNA-binding NarL/FixJ family response regulator
MTLQILLAEDNQTFANSVTRFVGLISGAHVVGHATDGDDAFERALELQPDLILMDIAMPKQSGLQVAQRLQLLERCPTIIFLSMHSDPAYREAARKVGGSHFVTKANFVSELFPLIEQMVRDRAHHH